ncbi:hypothetical protein GQX73_g5534 [Xylaria multiplex]|uniref:Carrier domain-containing protein n=1 Tax=Xylaria multiplex TaxID=323545 RepID=A0A7C8IU07_9PEZI|nr:hypothetical protein GQX73_g5534 [Xylaria multiplex]
MVHVQTKFRRPYLRVDKPSNDISIRSVPELVDFNAVTNPDALFCVQAIKGLADKAVTMGQLRDAVIRCKFALQKSLYIRSPIATEDGKILKSPPVALFMDSDLGLLFHLLALMGLGVPVLLLSIRLSHVAVSHLLSQVQAREVIASPGLVSKLQLVTQDLPDVRFTEAKPFVDYLNGVSIHKDARISDPSHFCDDFDRNVLILHSSGTTGLPKAIHQPHRYLIGYSTCHIETESEDIEGLNISTLPLYHGFGMLAPMLALSIGKVCHLPAPRTVPTGGSTIAILRGTAGARSLMTVPHILEEIVALPENEWVEPLRSLQFVACGGGPLKASVGEVLATARVKILAHFGATEIGALAPIFVPDEAYDWRFWRLRQDLDIRVEPINKEDEQENADAKRPSYFQLVARPSGWTEDFVLQDWLLMKTGPTDEKYLRAMGRKDDLIVLATGEKVLPRILERMLEESPLVKTSVAFGEGQFELGVIIEPSTYPVNITEFKNSIWPIIVEAGKQMDSHATLSSLASVIITTEDQKIPRSDKGSVSRKEVYRLFESEIRQAYELMDNTTVGGASQVLFRDDSLEGALKKIVASELVESIDSDALGVDDDLFELGLNSLQCVRIHRAVRTAVQHATNGGYLLVQMPSKDFVHRNPSVARMAAALRLNGHDDVIQDHTMEDYVSRYSLSTGSSHVVLLTGSSGSLGSHLLAHLIKLPEVVQVVCVRRIGAQNQADDTDIHEELTKELIKEAASKGASISPIHLYKVSVIPIQPSKQHLGLSEGRYSALCRTVTHILHTAWPMDFKRTLVSFESQFAYLQNLLQLARDIHTTRPLVRPRLAFTSSISVVGRYPQCNGNVHIVPEEIMGNAKSTNRFGYGYAKLVCELIVSRAAASAKNEMEVCCIRLGQIAGNSVTGFWNPKEHIPALVRVAQRAKVWPQLKGTLSWLPVDTCAAVISDIIQSPSPLEIVYHVENPVRQDWPSMLSDITSELGCANDSFIMFDQWCKQVAGQSTVPEEELLMDFFADDFQHMACGGVLLDTSTARQASETLRKATTINKELLQKYIHGWRKSGFLQLGSAQCN